MLGACTPKQSRRFLEKEAAVFRYIGFPLGGSCRRPRPPLMSKLTVIAHERVAEANSPLIRPCGATFPQGGKALV